MEDATIMLRDTGKLIKGLKRVVKGASTLSSVTNHAVKFSKYFSQVRIVVPSCLTNTLSAFFRRLFFNTGPLLTPALFKCRPAFNDGPFLTTALINATQLKEQWIEQYIDFSYYT